MISNAMQSSKISGVKSVINENTPRFEPTHSANVVRVQQASQLQPQTSHAQPQTSHARLVVVSTADYPSALFANPHTSCAPEFVSNGQGGKAVQTCRVSLENHAHSIRVLVDVAEPEKIIPAGAKEVQQSYTRLNQASLASPLASGFVGMRWVSSTKFDCTLSQCEVREVKEGELREVKEGELREVKEEENTVLETCVLNLAEGTHHHQRDRVLVLPKEQSPIHPEANAFHQRIFHAAPAFKPPTPLIGATELTANERVTHYLSSKGLSKKEALVWSIPKNWEALPEQEKMRYLKDIDYCFTKGANFSQIGDRHYLHRRAAVGLYYLLLAQAASANSLDCDDSRKLVIDESNTDETLLLPNTTSSFRLKPLKLLPLAVRLYSYVTAHSKGKLPNMEQPAGVLESDSQDSDSSSSEAITLPRRKNAFSGRAGRARHSLAFREEVFAYKKAHNLTFAATCKHFNLPHSTIYRWHAQREHKTQTPITQTRV